MSAVDLERHRVGLARKAVERIANCPLGMTLSEWSDVSRDILSAIDGIPSLIARIRELEGALGQIVSKNDLSGVPDGEVEAAAGSALYECELIARAALKDANKEGGA